MLSGTVLEPNFLSKRKLRKLWPIKYVRFFVSVNHIVGSIKSNGTDTQLGNRVQCLSNALQISDSVD